MVLDPTLLYHGEVTLQRNTDVVLKIVLIHYFNSYPQPFVKKRWFVTSSIDADTVWLGKCLGLYNHILDGRTARPSFYIDTSSGAAACGVSVGGIFWHPTNEPLE